MPLPRAVEGGAWLSGQPPFLPARQPDRHVTTTWHPRRLGLPQARPLVLANRPGGARGRPGWSRARGRARRMPNPPALDRQEDLWMSKGSTVGKRVWWPRCRHCCQRALPSGKPNHRPPRRCWEGDDGVPTERTVCQRQEHAICASPPLALRPGAALRTRNPEPHRAALVGFDTSWPARDNGAVLVRGVWHVR